MDDAKPTKVMTDDVADFYITQSDDNTQICVGVISDSPMTRDEFIDALIFFVDEVIDKDLQFLDLEPECDKH